MNINNYLRYGILSGIFLILFIPLYVSNEMFFPFISGKNFAFRIIVEIALALWLILAYRDASYRPKKTWMVITFGIFVAILAVADIFGENFYRSFWSNYERMEGLIAQLHFLAYFVLLATALTTEKLWERFFQTSLGVSVVMGIYALLQLAGKLAIHQGNSRLDATLGNATYLAVYMLFHIFIAAMFALRETTGKTMRYVYGAITLFDLFILYHTATRGAILGLLGGAFITSALLIFWNRENRLIRNAAIGIIAVVILSVGSVLVFRNSDFMKNNPVLSRFTSISLTETTTKSRFLIWNMSWQGVKEHPILGWGQENYIVLFNKYYDPKMYQQEPWFDRSHNVFFDWLVSGGILALLAYLSFFALAFYYLLRRGATFSVGEKSVLAGLLAGYFFQNIFVFDNMTSYLLFFSVLCYIAWRNGGAIGLATTFPTKTQNKQKNTATSTERVFVPVILVAMVAVIYFANIKPILASASIIQALKSQKDGVEKNLSLMEKVFSYNTFGSGEAREQLLQMAFRAQAINISPELKQKFFAATHREMLVQIDENPKDARYEFFFGAFLNKFGLYDEAMAHLKRALELSPKKQAIIIELADTYLGKREYQKAFELSTEAYKSEPNYKEARISYGVAALYVRQDKLAEELLLPIYGTMLIPDDRIINVYVERKEYEKVISIRKASLKNNPENPQLRLTLAAAYLKIGERDKSVAEIREVIKLYPDFKAQGEFYIKEIQAGRNP